MFDWLKTLFAGPPAAIAASQVLSDVRVSFDEQTIETVGKGGVAAAIAWDALARVSITTTDAGPYSTDLFWHLEDDAGHGLIVPMGAEGEHDLLQAMQRRLDGFDNMAVVEAMGSTERARFLVWSTDESAETGELHDGS
jgi:hypothetical protein